MAIVYRKGLTLQYFLYKMRKYKRTLILFSVLGVLLIAFLGLNYLKNRQVSVSEHASTDGKSTIAKFITDTSCNNTTFVVKYYLSVSSAFSNNEKDTYTLRVFIPSVIKPEWVTYISSGGRIGGSYYIEWANKDIFGNNVHDYSYTLTIPGGALQPGASFKTIAVLFRSDGSKDEKQVSVVIDSCGASVINPTLPPILPTNNTSTDTDKNSLAEDITISSNPSINGSEDNSVNSGGSSNTDNTVDDTNDELYDENNDQNDDTVTVVITDSDSSSSADSSSSSDSSQTNQTSTSSNSSVPDYVATGSSGSGTADINTGVFDSPITALVLLFGALFLRLISMSKKHYTNAYVQEVCVNDGPFN